MKKKPNYEDLTKDLFVGSNYIPLISQHPDGRFIHRGVLLSKAQSHAILEMASSVLQIPITRDLIEEIKLVAAKKLYHESKTLEDLSFAKGMLYAMDVFERKMHNLASQLK